jgi:hypothetical protein
MPNFITKLLSGGAKEIVDSVGGILDNVITNKEELAKAKLEADKEINRHIEMMATQSISVYELEVKDRESARDMFKHSSQLQKIYSITFLSAYVFLTVCMLLMASMFRIGQSASSLRYSVL